MAEPGRIKKRGSSSNSTTGGPSKRSASSQDAEKTDRMSDTSTSGMRGGSGSAGASTGMDMCEPGPPCSESILQNSSTHCPITDVNEKPFPLMDLPAEVRNEIYRACMTRPFNILLSRKEPPPAPQKVRTCDDEEDAEDDEAEGEGSASDIDYVASTDNPHASSKTAATDAAQAGAGSSRPQVTDPHTPVNHGGLLRRAATRPKTPRRARPTNTSSRSSRQRRSAAHSADLQTPLSHPKPEVPRKPRPQDVDPLLVSILRCNKKVYHEARAILYNENIFTLDLDTALPTLAALHQRSRGQIKHVELEIPSYNEILEKFQETVRLSLRYCWRLKKLVIHMPFTLPGADGSGTTGNTTVYANGFDILRWLPRQCEVELKGNICAEVEAVVSKNANLAKTLDEVSISLIRKYGGPWDKEDGFQNAELRHQWRAHGRETPADG